MTNDQLNSYIRQKLHEAEHRTGAARDVAMLSAMMASAAILRQIVRVAGWPDPTKGEIP